MSFRGELTNNFYDGKHSEGVKVTSSSGESNAWLSKNSKASSGGFAIKSG
ncbi:hypothetical protein H271_16190 [Vibrio parahaemolyticus 1911C]|nr:hypothetical protein H271_16190 [Vibrio parahaemolyticus 1911C]